MDFQTSLLKIRDRPMKIENQKVGKVKRAEEVRMAQPSREPKKRRKRGGQGV